MARQKSHKKSKKIARSAFKKYTKAAGEASNGDPIWNVEKIMDVRSTEKGFEYLVKWAGWPNSYNSWEPSSFVNFNPNPLESGMDPKIIMRAKALGMVFSNEPENNNPLSITIPTTTSSRRHQEASHARTETPSTSSDGEESTSEENIAPNHSPAKRRLVLSSSEDEDSSDSGGILQRDPSLDTYSNPSSGFIPEGTCPDPESETAMSTRKRFLKDSTQARLPPNFFSQVKNTVNTLHESAPKETETKRWPRNLGFRQAVQRVDAPNPEQNSAFGEGAMDLTSNGPVLSRTTDSEETSHPALRNASAFLGKVSILSLRLSSPTDSVNAMSLSCAAQEADNPDCFDNYISFEPAMEHTMLNVDFIIEEDAIDSDTELEYPP
ncbi:hypothetical protein BDP27DRAFT_1480562 [Rhodocollybia butyracea]|uniref:Chromo domain-containing protein n=1 Tax=Rhodocollybia butyracea TaxID=206335 RepID=A0A9P5Q1F3_9AGAR|nr:hypothetical protein BDP27DRAFT_1480562 [Rhodocollybia butyracea]